MALALNKAMEKTRGMSERLTRTYSHCMRLLSGNPTPAPGYKMNDKCNCSFTIDTSDGRGRIEICCFSQYIKCVVSLRDPDATVPDITFRISPQGSVSHVEMPSKRSQ